MTIVMAQLTLRSIIDRAVDRGGYRSVRALAETMNIENSTLERLRSGDTRAPSVPVLAKLAEASGIPFGLVLATAYPDVVDVSDRSLSDVTPKPAERELFDRLMRISNRNADSLRLVIDIVERMDKLPEDRRRLIEGLIDSIFKNLES